MMSEFTKGPWIVDEASLDYVVLAPQKPDGSGLQEIARVWFLGNDEHLANAQLIAAAQDLLEACEAFVEAYEKSLQLEKTDVAVRLAKVAIAKATGNG
jgi:hypothetical protein